MGHWESLYFLLSAIKAPQNMADPNSALLLLPASKIVNALSISGLYKLYLIIKQ